MPLSIADLQAIATVGWLMAMVLAVGYVVIPFRCDHRPGCPDCAREAREKKNGGVAQRAEFCPLCRERHTPDEPHGPNRD